MPQQKSERTMQMIRHFMELKREGYSNKEIGFTSDLTSVTSPDPEHSLLCSIRDSKFGDDLTGRQVKQLAKLISVVKYLEESDITFEIIFEDDLVEIVYAHLA